MTPEPTTAEELASHSEAGAAAETQATGENRQVHKGVHAVNPRECHLLCALCIQTQGPRREGARVHGAVLAWGRQDTV